MPVPIARATTTPQARNETTAVHDDVYLDLADQPIDSIYDPPIHQVVRRDKVHSRSVDPQKIRDYATVFPDSRTAANNPGGWQVSLP